MSTIQGRARVGAMIVTGLLTAPVSARAEGLQIGFDGQAQHPSRTVVQADIREQVATTTAELEFPVGGANPGRFAFGLPAGASVVGFAVQREGQWQEATVGSSDATATDAVSASGATSQDLSDYLGEAPFVIDLPPLGQTTVKVRLTYIQLLDYDLGQVSYTYPLPHAPWAPERSTDTTLTLRLQSDRALVGHGAAGYDALGSEVPTTDGGREFRYALGPLNAPTSFDFRYGLAQSDQLYVRLLTQRERCDEDGYFLLIVEPPAQVTEGQVIPKVFTFEMDTSGSMAGTKMSQAQQGARVGVERLNASDRFNVLAYSSSVNRLFDAPVDASDAHRQQALTFIDNQWAQDGTNISGALLGGLGAPAPEGYARVMVLLTDGQPTEGETDPFRIVQQVKQANQAGDRLFTIGIGQDVNRQLLTDLAVSNGGEARFVTDLAEVEGALDRLFQRVARPVLTNATTSFGSVTTSDVYPDGPRDLFAGTQLLVLGRFQGSGATNAALDGELLGAPQHADFSLEFPACEQGNAFLPGLWAKAKIDTLLAHMASRGQADQATIDEIESLGQRYGIQTPYSSFGVSERPPVTGGYGSSNGSPSSYQSGGIEDVTSCQVATAGRSAGLASAGLLLSALAAAGRRRRAGPRAHDRGRRP